MPNVHNFSITVNLPDGTPLPTYPCRNLTDPTTTTVYLETPPSHLPQTFTVTAQPLTPINYTLTAGYSFRLHLDSFSQSFFLRPSRSLPLPTASLASKTKRTVRLANGSGAGFTEHEMRFRELEWVESEEEAEEAVLKGGLCGGDLREVGVLKVEVREIASETGFWGLAGTDYGGVVWGGRKVYEGDKDVKGRGVTHGVSLESEPKTQGQYSSYISVKPELLGTVVFHYRSRRALKAMGIIPSDADSDFVLINTHRTTSVVVPDTPAPRRTVTSLLNSLLPIRNRQAEYTALPTTTSAYPDIDDTDDTAGADVINEAEGEVKKEKVEVEVVKPDARVLEKARPDLAAERRRRRSKRILARMRARKMEVEEEGGDESGVEVDLTRESDEEEEMEVDGL